MPEVHTQLNISTVTPREAEGDRANAAKQVVLYGPEARRVAFLGRLNSDLDLARKRCDLYLDFESNGADEVDMMALAADGAFIAYGRLAQGAGGSFPKEVFDAMTEQAQGEHRWALAMRDKFVGHVVNGLNRTIPEGAVSEDGELHYVFHITARVVPTVEDIRQLRNLTDTVQGALAPFLEAAQEALFAAASSGPSVWDNPQPQFVLVARTHFDYLTTAGELTGTFGIPAAIDPPVAQ